jgi:hypothetical protein
VNATLCLTKGECSDVTLSLTKGRQKGTEPFVTPFSINKVRQALHDNFVNVTLSLTKGECPDATLCLTKGKQKGTEPFVSPRL